MAIGMETNATKPSDFAAQALENKPFKTLCIWIQPWARALHMKRFKREKQGQT